MRAALFPGQGTPRPEIPTETSLQQPAIYELSINSWRAAAIECDWFAGHSLGSYAALAAAGALDADAGREVVKVRGEAMSEAAQQRPGAMIALLGCGIDQAHELAERHGLTFANDNAPGQIVLTGPIEGVDALEDEAPAAIDEGGKKRTLRLRRLAVSGAFHSPLITSAARRLSAALDDVKFGDASRVVANGTAQPYTDPRTELARELLAPVRWRESLIFLWKKGVREFVEFEPSGVLTGLVKRTLPDAVARKCDDLIGAAGSTA